MKKVLLSIYMLLAITSSFSQKSDEIKTNSGILTIQPIYHGAIVFTWNGKTIYVDPYGGAKAYEGVKKPDLILITDIHPDHLNAETLDAIKADQAIIVAPQAVADQIPDKYKPLVRVMNIGSSSTIFDVAITATPMYNLPEEPDSKHPKGRGNGYVLNFGNKLIYISGDTEDIPEMRALKNIDIAFVCMNLPYTMDINQASSAVLEFKPKIVYPYHYRGKDGLSDVNGFKELVNKGDKKIEVRLRNWYPF
ncbi:MAG: MBL fold metallo-hydrolase [Bacteroidia bacterium]|nr:MBL fold metallo-hydrolase [Bacteroidia bacterium]